MLAIYSRGQPALCHLLTALAERISVDCVWPADGLDVLRYTMGRAKPDPMQPRPWPLLNAKSVALYAPLLARKARQADWVMFTRPDQAALLPAFRQKRKIFYALDDYSHYRRGWEAQETALLAAADHIFAVSPALAEVLAKRLPGGAAHIHVSENAVPDAWIPPAPLTAPMPLPEGLQLPRPLAGVLGSISSRLRLDWLVETVKATPFLHWLFVGDIYQPEVRAEDEGHLAWLKAHPRCTFTGPRPYDELARFAAALDVAVMPYSSYSTNPHGSPMRLFLHLPYGRPILATPGCLAVEEFVPLVTLCADAASLAAALEKLQKAGFDDGLALRRWQDAHAHTWTRRAEQLILRLG